jgi:hypothetical protein
VCEDGQEERDRLEPPIDIPHSANICEGDDAHAEKNDDPDAGVKSPTQPGIGRLQGGSTRSDVPRAFQSSLNRPA